MSNLQKQPIPCPNCNRVKYFEGLCYYCKQREFRLSIEALTAAEVAAMEQDIINRLEEIENWDEVYINFNSLLAYRDINTLKIARAAFEKEINYPPTIYRDADVELQERMIARLLDPETKRPSDWLSCLAVVGSERVQQVFYDLELHPMDWRKNLYVGPAGYAQQGGWTFDESGQRIELLYQPCYAFLPDEPADQSTKLGTLRTDHCSNCGCQLINLMEFDGSDPRFSDMEIPGSIQIPVCPNCSTLAEKTIISYQINGDSQIELIEPFVQENYVPQEELDMLSEMNLFLSSTAKPIYYACGEEEIAHIGGHAQWVQDFFYDDCPQCQQKMKLLGSVPISVLMEGMEGTWYIENCSKCQVISVIHQQT